MIIHPWPLYYQAVTGLYLEAPEAGDQTFENRAEPQTWMWSTPFYQGSATVYTEEPETGDQTFENRAEPAPWMWSVPLFQSAITLDLSQPEAGDFVPPVRHDPEIWMWTVPLFLGSATEFTEEPEQGDFYPHSLESNIWMWMVSYFIGEAIHIDQVTIVEEEGWLQTEPYVYNELRLPIYAETAQDLTGGAGAAVVARRRVGYGAGFAIRM